MNINLFLYLISGLFSLALQVIWQRQLFIIFGGTTYSVAIILCAWMLGLATGSYGGGKVAGRTDYPSKLFCFTQILIAGYVLLSGFLFQGLNLLDEKIFIMQQNQAAVSLVLRILVTFFILMIPTTLFGAGLPILTKATGKKWIPGLYYLNTLGSVVGALLVTFLLLPVLGAGKSLFIVAILALAVNITVIFTVKEPRTAFKEETRRLPVKKEKLVFNPATKRILLVMIPVLFFLSGFTSLSYELLYNRIILFLFGTTTFYTFSIILIIFILAIALGAFCNHLLQNKLAFSGKLLVFALMEVLIGFWHVILPHYSVAINENQFLVSVMNMFSEDFTGTVFRRSIFSGLIILPPVFLFGFLYPLIMELYLYLKEENPEQNVGKLGLFNLCGSALGPILTGFLLIGFLQVAGSLRFVALINVLIGLAVFTLIVARRELGKTGRTSRVLAVITGLIFLGSFLIPPTFDAFQKIARMGENNKLLYYKEGVHATVSVTEKANRELSLNVNAMPEVPTDHDSIRTFRLLAYLPFTIKGDARSVLCIAFGGGITFGSICQVDSLREIICAEICRDVLDAAVYFEDFNHHVAQTHQNKIVFEDGRRFVGKTPEKFDVIICDSTHPAEADSWVLFTKEFYSACQMRLNSGGLMAQWIPVHGLPLRDYKTILRTFTATFPEAALFYCNQYSIIIGSAGPVRITPESLAKLLENSVIKADLEGANLSTIEEIEETRMLDNMDLKAFTQPGEIATEDFTPIQFSEIRRIGKQDPRIDIVNGFYDYLNLAQEKDPDFKYYQMTTLKLHELIYKGDYLNLLLYLDDQKPELVKRNLYDNEFSIMMNNAKSVVTDYFFKEKHILEIKNNPIPENVKLIERLSSIISDNFDFQFIKGVLYFKIQNFDKALQVFLELKKQRQIPELYQFIIVTLKQLGRNGEAESYLTEGRGKFGPGFGKGN